MLNYLASPYTHPDKQRRRKRARAVTMLACRLIQEKRLHIFSPIAHTHAIAECGDLPSDWDYWEEFDRIMLTASQRLLIAEIEGWEDSNGIMNERKIMSALGRPIVLVNAETLEFTPL